MGFGRQKVGTRSRRGDWFMRDREGAEYGGEKAGRKGFWGGEVEDGAVPCGWSNLG